MGEKKQFEETPAQKWIKIALRVLEELDKYSNKEVSELKKRLDKEYNDLINVILKEYPEGEEKQKAIIDNIKLCVGDIEKKFKDNINTNLETIKDKIEKIKSCDEKVADALKMVFDLLVRINNREDLCNENVIKLSERVGKFLQQVTEIENRRTKRKYKRYC